jgi:dipeptidyl aminopeptidase/acylaminoacyl peptidase
LNLKTEKALQITDVNRKALKFKFGRSELLSWKSKSEDELLGVFLYPTDYEPGKRYPVIVEVYSTFSSNLHRFFTYLYNLQILTNQGYGVLLPDIEFNGEDLPRSYLDCVEPALDHLEKLGIANGKFGIMGHSFGGYGANVLITHSRRFQAGVSLAGFCNWISYQAAPADFNRGYIIGCNQMGAAKPPRDYQEKIKRYIHNSPLHFIHKISSPLLIIHGMEDQTVPFDQAEEMFYVLRSEGKTAVLVGYPGESHLWSGTKVRVFEDMWKRIISWFNQYLK